MVDNKQVERSCWICVLGIVWLLLFVVCFVWLLERERNKVVRPILQVFANGREGESRVMVIVIG